MNDAVLEIEGLTVRSAEGDALVKNVGLCLKRQECLGIAGESGSGKTITAKAILHLLPQDLTASVTHLRVLGEDLLNLPEKERRIFLGKKIGFVPQNTVAYLHPLIKIKNQLTDGYRIQKGCAGTGENAFGPGGYPRRKPRDGELSRTNLRRDAPKGKHSHGADVRASGHHCG